MKRAAQAEYYLAREQQELALSQAPGEPEVRAVHREMARLYGERARNQTILDAPAEAVETPAEAYV